MNLLHKVWTHFQVAGCRCTHLTHVHACLLIPAFPGDSWQEKMGKLAISGHRTCILKVSQTFWWCSFPFRIMSSGRFPILTLPSPYSTCSFFRHQTGDLSFNKVCCSRGDGTFLFIQFAFSDIFVFTFIHRLTHDTVLLEKEKPYNTISKQARWILWPASCCSCINVYSGWCKYFGSYNTFSWVSMIFFTLCVLLTSITPPISLLP